MTSNGVKNSEEELAEQIAKIQELAKTNKNLDATAMITSLLEQHQSSSIPNKMRIRAFLVSMIFPPFGLYYVIKFLFSPERDARRLALICFLLTAGAIIFFWAILNVILSPYASNLEQIQNIDLKQIQELTQ